MEGPEGHPLGDYIAQAAWVPQHTWLVHGAAAEPGTWRTKILRLLEEYHYGEDVKVEQWYGLASLRDAIS